MNVGPVPAEGARGRPWRAGLGHRLAASRLLVDPDPALDKRRRAVLQTVGGRNAVLVDLNLAAGTGAAEVMERFKRRFSAVFPAKSASRPPEPQQVSGYFRCRLTPQEITKLLTEDGLDGDGATIFRVWPDYILRPHLDRSVSTISADAARRVYAAAGDGIVWAVIDSGVEASHPHFGAGTLSDPRVHGLHRDFTYLVRNEAAPSKPDPCEALKDPAGHGTHVAGVIAGELPADRSAVIATSRPTAGDLPNWVARAACGSGRIAGVAPQARLVSLRVLDVGDDGEAMTVSSAVIAALARVREVNADGRRLRVHGVNLSLGCPWFPDDFAAGQSPLCRELDLLVGTGVVAVVSAGNSGASGTLTGQSSDVTGALSSISDPGNAASAITVGSTHKDSPHVYGVSYTSSKGPTLDGRVKPDLVAPGEHIASAASAAFCKGVAPLTSLQQNDVAYREESGTSMAAPHVSGAIAAFLSARGEYIGRPDEVKRFFLSQSSSLNRHEFYQGAGLVDLMAVLSNL
jgi:subtilisin family serine protease